MTTLIEEKNAFVTEVLENLMDIESKQREKVSSFNFKQINISIRVNNSSDVTELIAEVEVDGEKIIHEAKRKNFTS